MARDVIACPPAAIIGISESNWTLRGNIIDIVNMVRQIRNGLAVSGCIDMTIVARVIVVRSMTVGFWTAIGISRRLAVTARAV
jgi:hypothetical protein